MYDLIIKNAWVIDGTGTPPFKADVAVADGKIRGVGTIAESAARVIDAEGLAVTPGFIDSHSHSDYSLISGPDQAHSPEQGITFSVTGHCGSSVSPAEKHPRFSQFAEKLADLPLGVNAGVLAGAGDLRRLVAGTENRPLTDGELAEMCRLLEDSMDAGAMGLSLGLTYPPGGYADFRELSALACVVGKKGGILTAHIRNESDQLIESAEEFISLCKAGGCRGVISHLKAADKPNHGKVRTVLAMMEAAQKEGVEIYADAYPYCASSTSFTARFIPRQFHPKGTTSVVALLKDSALRSRLKAWATEKWGTDLSWVLLTFCPLHPEYVGKNMNEIAEAMGFSDRYDAVYALLEETKGMCKGCFTMMCEEDVKTALAHPWVMVGTDSNMGSIQTMSHPRRVGTFPRVLGRYVRQEQITSLPEMIRKITSLPAYVYRLEGKGQIAEGYDADLCIFDPETIRDEADYVNCFTPNVGMAYVVISGKVVVEQGKYNGTRAGRLYLADYR